MKEFKWTKSEEKLPETGVSVLINTGDSCIVGQLFQDDLEEDDIFCWDFSETSYSERYYKDAISIHDTYWSYIPEVCDE